MDFPFLEEAEELGLQGIRQFGSPALVVEGRLQKKDGTLSIRAERFERMSLEEPIPELREPVSPPSPRHRESTPSSHDFR